jgi:hypothetical protein
MFLGGGLGSVPKDARGIPNEGLGVRVERLSHRMVVFGFYRANSGEMGTKRAKSGENCVKTKRFPRKEPLRCSESRQNPTKIPLLG